MKPLSHFLKEESDQITHPDDIDGALQTALDRYAAARNGVEVSSGEAIKQHFWARMRYKIYTEEHSQ